MTNAHESITVLSRALDQAGDVLAGVHADQLEDPTPCEDWTVEQLIAHVLAAPSNFALMMAGGEPDWAADPPPLPQDPAAAFRSDADDLIHLWHGKPDAEAPGADMQITEFAVHTWDLARATGQTDKLDPEVAERGLSFMTANLKPEMRGGVFKPELDAAADAPAYDRLAAFAGRDPS